MSQVTEITQHWQIITRMMRGEKAAADEEADAVPVVTANWCLG